MKSSRGFSRLTPWLFGLLLLVSCSQNSSEIPDTRSDPMPEVPTPDGPPDLDKPTGSPDSYVRVEAGPLQFADPNLLVDLSGRVESGPGAPVTNVRWTQLEGPEAPILQPRYPNTAILTPDVTRPTRLVFHLHGVNSEGDRGADTTSVIVQPLDNAARVVSGARSQNSQEVPFEVLLARPANQPTQLNYHTQDGTALAGLHYLRTEGELLFDTGEQSKTLEVTLLDTAPLNESRYFSLRISGQVEDMLGVRPINARATAVILPGEGDWGNSYPTSPPQQVTPNSQQAQLPGAAGVIRIHLSWIDAQDSLGVEIVDPCGQTLLSENNAVECLGGEGFLQYSESDIWQSAYWPEYAAPGEYKIYVQHLSGLPAQYDLQIFLGDKTLQFTGVIANGDRVPLYTFEYEGTAQSSSSYSSVSVHSSSASSLPVASSSSVSSGGNSSSGSSSLGASSSAGTVSSSEASSSSAISSSSEASSSLSSLSTTSSSVPSSAASSSSAISSSSEVSSSASSLSTTSSSVPSSAASSSNAVSSSSEVSSSASSLSTTSSSVPSSAASSSSAISSSSEVSSSVSSVSTASSSLPSSEASSSSAISSSSETSSSVSVASSSSVSATSSVSSSNSSSLVSSTPASSSSASSISSAPASSSSVSSSPVSSSSSSVAFAPMHLSLDMPDTRVYYEPVAIRGNVAFDSRLNLSVELHVTPAGAETFLLTPEIDGGHFYAVVEQPGTYDVRIVARDGVHQQELTTAFEFIAPRFSVTLNHEHSLDEFGRVLTADKVLWDVGVESNIDFEPESFVLEWTQGRDDFSEAATLQRYPASEVWNKENLSARIVYDFYRNDHTPEQALQTRLRLNLADGRSLTSEGLTVYLRKAEEPDLVLQSPEPEGLYFDEVLVAGQAGWDAMLTGTVEVDLLLEQPLSVPVTIDDQLAFSASVPTEDLNTGDYQMRVRVEDSLNKYVQQIIPFRYVRSEALRATFVEPVRAGDYETMAPVLSLVGRIQTTPELPLQNLSVQIAQNGETIREIAILLGGQPVDGEWDGATGQFTLPLALAEQFGPGRYEFQILASDALPQSVTSDPITIDYRQPDALDIVLRQPIAESVYYSEQVSVEGQVVWDPALSLSLNLYIEDTDEQVRTVRPIEHENGSFQTLEILPPGNYRLGVEANDGIQRRESSVEFVRIDPGVTLDVDHQHPLIDDALIDTIGRLQLTAIVGNPHQVPLWLFALEQRANDGWQSLEIFEADEVLLDSGDSAQLDFDFATWDLPFGRYDLRLRLDYADDRSAYAELPFVDYRAADRLRLALESPTDEALYFAPVPVRGSASADSLLPLVLSAQLERLDIVGPASSLVLGRDLDAFSYAIEEPGDYLLTVTASDGRETLTESRRFSYLADQAKVTLLHRHLLTPEGDAIDLVDALELHALVELDERIQLRAFTLEFFGSEGWQTMTTYPVEEVWDSASRSANLQFEFADLPFALYQVRARVHYAEADSASSDPILVNYRPWVSPSVELSSPLDEQKYLEPIAINGEVSWDAVRGTPTLALHWREQGESEPHFGIMPLHTENGTFSGVFTPPSAGNYSVFIRVTDSTGATWNSETFTFTFLTPSAFSLALTSPTFDASPAVYVLPQMEVAGTLAYDPAGTPENLLLALERDGETVAEQDLLNREADWQGDFSLTLPIQSFGAGDYILRLMAEDSLGRTDQAEAAFTYREPAIPVLTVETLPAEIVGDVTISGSITWDALLGEQGVRDIWMDLYYLGETPRLVREQIPLSLVGSEFKGTIDHTLMPGGGDYRIVLRARDIAGTPAADFALQFKHRQSNAGLYMPMDELVDGVLPDLDGFNNAGTLVGPLENRFETGVHGNALRFGANAYVTVADHNEINVGTGDFSIFVWVKTSRTRAIQPLVEKRLARDLEVSNRFEAPGYTFYLTGAGEPALQMMSLIDEIYDWNNYGSEVVVTNGTWRHIGVSVRRNEPNGGQFYVDGEVVARFTPTRHSTSLTNTAEMKIGRHAETNGYFDGSLDELVIAKHALSEVEVQELMSRARFEVPQQRQLEVTNPTAQELYRSELNLQGSYSVDQGLTPVTIQASVVHANGQSVDLPLQIDPEAATADFQLPLDCRYFSVGTQNTLQMRLTDALNQTLSLAPIDFTFTVKPPQVALEEYNSDDMGVAIYGSWVRDPACEYDTEEQLRVSVSVNDQPANISVEPGQLPGDFVFFVPRDLLSDGDNMILVAAADSRDPDNAVGTATIKVVPPVKAGISITVTSTDGSSQQPLTGDLLINFTSNISLDRAIVAVNGYDVADLFLRSQDSPYVYSTVLWAHDFRSGINLIAISGVVGDDYLMRSTIEVDYLDIYSDAGSF